MQLYFQIKACILTGPSLYTKACEFHAVVTPCYSSRSDFGPLPVAALEASVVDTWGQDSPLLHQGPQKRGKPSPLTQACETGRGRDRPDAPQPVWQSLPCIPNLPPPGAPLPPTNPALSRVLPEGFWVSISALSRQVPDS